MTFPKRIDDESNPVNGNAESIGEIMQMKAQIELITPELAAEILAGQAPNRKESREHSNRIQRALKSGNWYVSSQGIGVDWAGRCIDGQHRLDAIIKTGVAVWMPVVRGLSPNAQKVIDDGKKRMLADDHKIAGHADYTALAGFQNMTFRFEYGAKRGLPLSVTRTLQLSRIEALEAGERYAAMRDIYEIIQLGHSARKKYRIPESSFDAAYYLGLEYKPEEQEAEIHRFFNQVATGYNISPGGPAAAMHNAIRIRREGDSKRGVDTTETVAVLLHGLGIHLKGKPLRLVKWNLIARKAPRELLT